MYLKSGPGGEGPQKLGDIASKLVKSTIVSFYWLTRDIAFCGLPPAGPDFRYTNFSGGRGFPHFTYTHFSGCRHRRILPTQTFRVAVTVAFAFYLHKLFEWPGFCILPTHTFGAILRQN